MPTLSNIINNRNHNNRKFKTSVEAFATQIATEFNKILDLQFRAKDVIVNTNKHYVDFEIVVGNDERNFLMVFYYYQKDNKLMICRVSDEECLSYDGWSVTDYEIEEYSTISVCVTPEEIAEEMLLAFSPRDIARYSSNKKTKTA